MQWSNEWKCYKSYRDYNKYFEFSPKGYTQTIKPRCKETLMARLRLGSAALNSHLHKIGVCSSPLCPHCLVPETVEHVLLNCSFHFLLHNSVDTILKTKMLRRNLFSILSDLDIQSVIYKYCKSNELRW